MYNCAWDNCESPSKSSYSSSKSKYCNEHAPMAYKAWKKAKDEADEVRANRYAGFQELWERATRVGAKAFEDAKPTPMVVQQHANMLDDSSRVVKSWDAPEGVCGFAWLSTRPGNSSFAHWAKKNVGARSDSYAGGLRISLPFAAASLSLERKEAGASAMAKVLREGLEELDPKAKVHANSRID